jgi:O-antigen/teichoic acid export membrane protein
MNVALGRVIGTTGYGTFSYTLALTGILSIVVPLGLPTALMRFVAQYVEQRRWGLLKGAVQRAYQLTLLTSIGAALALWMVAHWPGLSQDLATSIRYAALILPLLSFVGLRQKALQGLQRIKSSMVPEMILLPLVVIGGVYLFGVNTAPGALLVYAGAASVAFVVGNTLLLRSMPEQSLSAKPEFQTRVWMTVALPMAFGGLSQIIMNRTDVLMLGAMTNMESVGLYSAANRIAMLNTFAMTAVSTIAAPMMAAAFYGERLREAGAILRRASLVAVAGSLPLFAVMLLLPSLPLGFFGPQFLDAKPLLRILAFGQFVNAATGPVGFALVMTGREQPFAWATAGAAVLNVIGNFLLIPLYGAVGSATATAASVAILNLVLLLLVWKGGAAFTANA